MKPCNYFSLAGLSLRAWDFPRLLWGGPQLLSSENRRKIEPEEIPSCVIPCQLIIYYFYLATGNCSDNPALVKICIYNVGKNVSYGVILIPITKESLNFFLALPDMAGPQQIATITVGHCCSLSFTHLTILALTWVSRRTPMSNPVI